MRKLLTAPALALAFSLAGCSDEPTTAEVNDKEVTDLNSANTDGKAYAQAKALPAGDLTELRLGGRTAERTTAMANGYTRSSRTR